MRRVHSMSCTTGKTHMSAMRKLPVVPVCRRPPPLPIYVNQKYDPRHPASMQRDVSRSSRHVRRGCDGRFGDAREFLVRTNVAGADVKACGPRLPTLRSSRAAANRAMTGARKPGSRGEYVIIVKTIAQGMPDDSAEPVVTAACFFYCRRAMGEAVTRHSLRPLLSEGARPLHTPGATRRGIAKARLCKLPSEGGQARP